MKEKNVSNEQLSNILLNSRQALHRKQAYQKLAEKILFQQAYTFDDFYFVNEKSQFSIANFSKSPEMVFAQLKSLLEAMQEQLCTNSNEDAIKNFFGFVDKIQEPDVKVSPLLYCAINAQAKCLREQSLFRLMKLPKLSSENEYFLLEQSVKHTFLCRELYPERLSFLNPECNYGCILKKLHIGDPNQDKIGVWIVVNSGSFCPNEMLKYLSLRSEMCMPHTPGTEEIAIRSFANFRYKFYSNFDTELLRQFIKSRNLSPQADIKILDLICRHIQDQALLEEYGRLSLMCGIDTLSKTLDVFKRHGDKWPESQIAFYTAIIKQYPQDEICDMAYTYIHFTIKSISLHQKELLSEKGSILKLLKTLSDCASNGKYRSLGSKIVSEIIHIPELISAEILSILLLQWKDELQTELNRYTNTSHLSKILDMLIELKTPNTDAKQFVELKQSAISHVVKNILVLDSRLNDKLAEILYQFKLTNLKSLPSSIKKSISDIEREELDFQSFMQAFA